MNFQTGTRAGVHAREEPAPRLDPLGEVKRDLEAVLALLQATRVRGMGRRRDNQFAHAVAAAQREVRRGLAVLGGGGAGPG